MQSSGVDSHSWSSKRKSSRLSFYVLCPLHLFICVWGGGEHVPWHICEGQRQTWYQFCSSSTGSVVVRPTAPCPLPAFTSLTLRGRDLCGSSAVPKQFFPLRTKGKREKRRRFKTKVLLLVMSRMVLGNWRPRGQPWKSSCCGVPRSVVREDLSFVRRSSWRQPGLPPALLPWRCLSLGP